jgi:hypothetical protein
MSAYIDSRGDAHVALRSADTKDGVFVGRKIADSPPRARGRRLMG